MELQCDPLSELTKICDGSIQIIINDHRNSYQSVEDYLEERSAFVVVPPKARRGMITADRLFTLVFVPIFDNRETVRLYGSSAYEVLMRGCYHIRLQRKQLWLPPVAGGTNLTHLLDALADACKGQVILTINPFKNKWQPCADDPVRWDATAKDYFKDLEEDHPESFQLDKDGEYEISPAERQAMEELNQVLHVQFYPNTPVGFYDWHDTDMGDMLERAVEQAKLSVNSSVERLVELMAESKLT